MTNMLFKKNFSLKKFILRSPCQTIINNKITIAFHGVNYS